MAGLSTTVNSSDECFNVEFYDDVNTHEGFTVDNLMLMLKFMDSTEFVNNHVPCNPNTILSLEDPHDELNAFCKKNADKLIFSHLNVNSFF